MTAAEEPEAPGGSSRRTLLLGTGAVGMTALLAACGDSDDGDDGTTNQPAASATTGGADPTADGGGAGAGFAKTSAIPVGGGAIFAAQKVVVTQPAAGEFKAFSSTCTHAGCQLADVSNGTINCGCHGSKFALDTGEPKNGPASRPLAAKQITVSGEDISLA